MINHPNPQPGDIILYTGTEYLLVAPEPIEFNPNPPKIIDIEAVWMGLAFYLFGISVAGIVL